MSSSKNRNRTRQTGGHDTSTEAALYAIESTLSKEKSYRQDIVKIQARIKILGAQLAQNGDLETALINDKDNDEETNLIHEGFLTEQRTRLKELSAANARRDEEIDKFISTMTKLKDDIMRNHSGSNNDDGDDPVDYVSIITESMNEVFSKRQSRDEVEAYYQHEFCAQLREKLGEKSKTFKRSRHSREEDDIEVMPESTFTQSNSASDPALKLKCPITKMLYNNPFRSTICKHVYDKEGLEQMWRSKKYKCPVPGCSNNRVQENLVEEDIDMRIQVEDYKRRQDRAKQEDDSDLNGATFVQ